MIPVLGLAPELHALEVLVGEGGSSSELYAQHEFLKWCWGSGTGALYRPECRPTDSPSSCPNWVLELWLVDGLPCCVTGEYTAGHMADIGSLCGRPIVVSWSGTMGLGGAPELWAAHHVWLNISPLSALSIALLCLLCTRFLFLLGGGGAVDVALVGLSVILFLGTGGQISCDELRHTELSMRVSGARTRTSLDGAIGVSEDFSLSRGRWINIPGHWIIIPGLFIMALMNFSFRQGLSGGYMMRLAGRGITHPVYSAVSQRCFHNYYC